jgi:hypothetical protein
MGKFEFKLKLEFENEFKFELEFEFRQELTKPTCSNRTGYVWGTIYVRPQIRYVWAWSDMSNFGAGYVRSNWILRCRKIDQEPRR